MFRVGSLFAGIGGICLGFLDAHRQYQVVFANECDAQACRTYRHNFAHPLIEGDIADVLYPERAGHERDGYAQRRMQLFAAPIDVLTAGFPCQPFSIAGARRGFDDDRGNVFWHIVTVLLEHATCHGQLPRVVFLENVKNLATHDRGQTWTTIKNALEQLGYTVHARVLNTMYYSDLPQNRERMYIVCFRDKDDAAHFVWPQPLPVKTAQQRQEDIARIVDVAHIVHEKYYYTPEKHPHYFVPFHKDTPMHTPRVHLGEQVTEMHQFYQVRRGMYVRKNKRNVCPTLTANMGTGGHNVPIVRTLHGIRKLTPEETLMIQGFPIGERYFLPTTRGKPLANNAVYKQAGNAVSVPVVSRLASAIWDACTRATP
jgi:DNA (cytosine-5)-methyltransferase 1